MVYLLDSWQCCLNNEPNQITLLKLKGIESLHKNTESHLISCGSLFDIKENEIKANNKEELIKIVKDIFKTNSNNNNYLCKNFSIFAKELVNLVDKTKLNSVSIDKKEERLFSLILENISDFFKIEDKIKNQYSSSNIIGFYANQLKYILYLMNKNFNLLSKNLIEIINEYVYERFSFVTFKLFLDDIINYLNKFSTENIMIEKNQPKWLGKRLSCELIMDNQEILENKKFGLF